MGNVPDHHEVVEDHREPNRHTRLICKKEGCGEDKIVRKNWQTDEMWERSKSGFFLKHPQSQHKDGNPIKEP